MNGMGFEVSHNCPLQEMESKELVSSRHTRSKSDSMKRVKQEILGPSESFQHLKLDLGNKAKCHTDVKRRPDPVTVVRSSLKQEILQLERRLKDQLEVRGALEKAMGFNRPSAIDSSNDSSMPKPTKELIKEIAVLELEVMYLEQYLLSLYRRAFDQQVSTVSPTTAKEKSGHPLGSLQRRLFHEDSKLDIPSDRTNSGVKSSQTPKLRKPVVEQADDSCLEKLTGPGVHRCQSALSHRAVYSARISPSEESLARALQSCHSQPLNFIEDGHCSTSGLISLAEYLGTNIADHLPETPNRISEDMVRCMGAIYCKIADPPLLQFCIPSSPTSSFSSTSALSPQYIGDMWSPSCKKESTLDARLINPFRVEGMKEFSGPYNAMVEVPLIRTDAQKLSEVDDLLQNYKSLVQRLETMDPRKMKNEEKLAFWINIHNAITMHTYLDYGVPHKNTKKESLLIRASCVVGGRSISAYTIQCYILGCRTHCPGQWFRSLLSPKSRLKSGGEWRAYAIDRPEALLHFALCSGSHADPAVRVYSCKRVFQQLEAAKVDYIRATVGIKNEEKILLPKVMDSYAKDVNLSSQGILDAIKRHLPETLRMALQRCQQGRSHKIIEWVPYNSAFRYLLSRELASPQIL